MRNPATNHERQAPTLWGKHGDKLELSSKVESQVLLRALDRTFSNWSGTSSTLQSERFAAIRFLINQIEASRFTFPLGVEKPKSPRPDFLISESTKCLGIEHSRLTTEAHAAALSHASSLGPSYFVADEKTVVDLRGSGPHDDPDGMTGAEALELVWGLAARAIEKKLRILREMDYPAAVPIELLLHNDTHSPALTKTELAAIRDRLATLEGIDHHPTFAAIWYLDGDTVSPVLKHQWAR